MAANSGSSVSVRGNRVVVSGHVTTTQMTRLICRALNSAFEPLLWSEIVLDFSECVQAEQAAMLPLMPIVTSMRATQAAEFTLVRPHLDLVDRAFSDCHWAHIIEPERFGRDSGVEDVLPALQFESEEEAQAIPDRVMEVVIRNTAVSPPMLRMIEWSLYEILDNVINHSESAIGGFAQATPLREHVEFVVADAGIGIPSSLGHADEANALRQSVRQGVTRDRASNQGNGLYGSLQVAANSSGEFEISSHGASMRYASAKGRSGMFVKTEELRYPGTAVRARIGVAESGVLHKTLRFGGLEHDPAYGYVERHFETDEGEMLFHVRDQAARDVRTRRGGQRVRQELENLLKGSETITVDFSGVEVISSSFADEVFGRLFVSLGPRTFTKRVILTNANEDIDGLIDLAIDQRWRTATSG